jgi:hypothetical protein
LRPIEQRCQNNRRPDGAYHVSHIINLGKILANQGNHGDLVAKHNKPDCPARDLYCFPPADVRVKGASQVVLEDLQFIERPGMVFVLADTKPTFAG